MAEPTPEELLAGALYLGRKHWVDIKAVAIYVGVFAAIVLAVFGLKHVLMLYHPPAATLPHHACAPHCVFKAPPGSPVIPSFTQWEANHP